MNRYRKDGVVIAGLLAVVLLTSGCELSLPITDCSWIDQPDMGGLICLGANAIAITGGALAIIIALAIALGGGGGA